MNEAERRVLIVDDDTAFRSKVSDFLLSQGIRVSQAGDASEAHDACRSEQFDLVVLDLVLPGVGGKVLCRQLVETTASAIIVVSDLDSDDERISLLELGADDYIVKPFNNLELLARINAVLRRVGAGESRRINSFGHWCVDESERKLTRDDGVVVALTPSEAQLLRLFISSPGIVFGREEILAVARVRQYNGTSDRSVDNLVRRLRQKIGDDPQDPRHIQTMWGQGYVFRP